MKTTLQLTRRNTLLFFRNKSQVFFSLLAVFIILGLYILFISDLQVKDLEATVGHVDGAKALVNSWVMAGIIAVTTITTALSALGRIVRDRENSTINDFLVSPIKRTQVFMSYILSTLVISFIISTACLVIAELYIVSSGGAFLSLIQILEVLGIIILCILSSSLLMLFIISFLKSVQSLSVLGNIVGTLVGFITGAYIPVGILPKGVQFVSNMMPVSQGAALFRQILMDAPMKQVFEHAPKSVLVDYQNLVGVNISLNGHQLTPLMMVTFIIVSIIIFGFLNAWRFKKMKI